MSKYRVTGIFVLLSVAISICSAPASAGEKDLASLLDGVSQIAAPGIPGPLCVFEDGAFPVVAGNIEGARAPVVAAARMGKGRVVAFGHTDYLSGGTLAKNDTGRLMLNAIRWAAGKQTAGENKIGVALYRVAGPQEYLERNGFKTRVIVGGQLAKQLKAIDVLCVYPARVRDEGDLEAMRAYVRSGGGLVAADLGWGWLQLNRGKTLQEDHPGNRLLAPAGIMWADGYLRKTGSSGYVVSGPPSKLLGVNRAIEALQQHENGSAKLNEGEVSQAVSTIAGAIRTVAGGNQQIGSKLGEIRQDKADIIPRRKRPLSKRRSPLGHLILSMQIQDALRLPPEQVQAHPAADDFPGGVPADAKPVTRSLSIDTHIVGWHSTGLYAPPGKLITVEVDQNAENKGLHIRIGAHSDKLWNKETWRRCPEICRRFPIAAQQTRAANAFGGLIYIETPRGNELGTLTVKISGGIETPWYVLGRTDLKRWREDIRNRPGPWAELQTSKVILTVPSKVVRDLDDPKSLMEFWDKVMDSCADLAGWPRERVRPERYCADAQISAGYMHSGYPIMTLLDIIEVLVDKEKLTSNAHGGIWGLFHETGHNHQSRDWTFQGTVEVTVNLFTIYVLENACGLSSEAHPSFTKKARAGKLKRYLEGGAKFEAWKRDPFLALDMYIQMQEAFGWDAFKKVFAEYRNLPAGERPRSDDEKRDQWLVRFSRTVGRNLGPYFQAWGVPTSKTARNSVSELPVWMPKGFPSKEQP
ncbi:MAG: M60 family metallopeptidase [Planctomycetes bacterium]|nr:M60 family metallopeptidase [Planctomycetota bacterium]